MDPALLEILVCPVSGGKLHYDADTHELISVCAGLAYPIHDGIPVLLPEKARQLARRDMPEPSVT